MRLCAPCLPLLPLAAALVLGVPLAPAPARADEPAPRGAEPAREPLREPGREPARAVDLVLCLDTSGSMQGLIDAARRKLWSLVSELATAKPMPTLRVALLTYGSPGDAAAGYVVRQTPFTTDLDLVSERLFALGTNGGEEYVGRVVAQALEGLAWTSERALKLVFVAGNESADQDREQPFRQVLARAAERGVIVNAIYCGGPDDGDAAGWREVALLGKGRFASIDKDRGTLAIVTPFDQELAALSVRLNGTYVAYGREADERKARQEAQDRNAAGAGAPAAAERAAAKASDLYDNQGWDLVDRLQKDAAFDPAQLKAEELPEALRKVPAGERRAWLEQQGRARAALREQIQALDLKRQAHVKAEMARQRLSDKDGLDRALREALREQAAAAGLTFEAPAPR